MLNRAITVPSYAPNWWTAWRAVLTARQPKLLLRYVVVLVVLCVLGCIYLAQMNVITNLSSKTYEAKLEAVDLEAENASLMLRLAQLETPAAIAAQANAQGLSIAGAPTIVSIPPTADGMEQVTAVQPIAQAAEPANSSR